MAVLKRITLLCALLLGAGAAHAVSLGAIELQSTLNQPLRAIVPLQGVDENELSGLRARLASRERFEAAGLIREDYLREVELAVENDERGRPVIRVRGSGLLREPVLDLLIELQQGRDIFQRGYTLLIDPPDVARERRAESQQSPQREPAAETPSEEAAARTQPEAAAERNGGDRAASGTDTEPDRETGADEQASGARPAESGSPEADEPEFFDEERASTERELDPELLAEIEAGRDRPQPRAEQPAQQQRQAEDGVYEVRAQETLWRVAFNTRGDDIDMAQQMLALVIANPEAFDNGRITALLRGSRLRVPEADAVRAIDIAEAEETMAALEEERLRSDELERSLPAGDASPDEGADEARERTAGSEPDATQAEDEEREAAASAQSEDAEAVDDAADDADGAVAVDTDASQGMPSDDEAAALLLDRALNEAQRRAAKAEAGEGAEEGEAASRDDDEEEAEGAIADSADGDPAGGAAGSGESDGGASDAQAEAGSTEEPAAGEAASGSGMNWPLIAAVIAVVALLIALLVWRRRRGAVADDAGDEEDMPVSPAAEAAAARSAAAAGAAAPADEAASGDEPATSGAETEAAPMPAAAGDEDPLADADFRIAYGMFDDAAARLQEAIRQEPERADLRVKLAEVHHAAEQREAFLEAADAASGCGLDDEQRREIARMADRIAPDSRHASQAAAGAAFAAAASEASAPGDAETGVAETPADTAMPGTEGESGLDVDLARLDSGSEAASADAEPAPESTGEALDFDLDQLDAPLQDAGTPAPEGDTAEADNLLDFDLSGLDVSELEETAPAEPPDGADNTLDFDLDALDLEAGAAGPDSGEAGDAGTADDAGATDLELDDFSLADFDAGDAEAPAPPAQPEPSGESAAPAAGDDDFAIGGLELEQEGEPAAAADAMAGQLEMAEAYVDLGEAELARPMLQEVAEGGDAEQQSKARALLDKLG